MSNGLVLLRSIVHCSSPLLHLCLMASLSAALTTTTVPLAGHRFPKSLVLKRVPAADVPYIAEMERASYPADEAATPESLAFRQSNAGEFFWGCYPDNDTKPIGFVCGTLTKDITLTHDSMGTHEPDGSSLCIHSVCVGAEYRRHGVASAMLRSYSKAVTSPSASPTVQRILLIAKAPLLRFYVGAGFSLVGLSSVVHGQDPWFEMRLDASANEPFVQVDAFATEAFTGNPAAVVFTHRGGDARWMQRVANEFSLPETAFVEERPSSTSATVSEYDLRWFTPTTEVALCGHATLASAHALYSTGRVDTCAAIRFHTRESGVLQVTRSSDGFLSMDFPSEAPASSEGEKKRARSGETKDSSQLLPSAAEIADALGFGDASHVVCIGRNRIGDILIELDSLDTFGRLTPSLPKLRALKRGIRGFIPTVAVPEGKTVQESISGADVAAGYPSLPPATMTDRVDFVSRFFAPSIGIDEDPVCGSAHCALAPFWAEKLGKSTMLGWQCSARGGTVRVTLDANRVELAGRATTAMTGHLKC